MALGKAELRKRAQLVEHIASLALTDTFLNRALHKTGAEAFHRLARPPPAHRPPELIGLTRREATHLDRHFQHLVLVQHDAERVPQQVIQQRMVGSGDVVRVFTQQLAPPHIRVNRTADDRPRSHDGYLDRQIIQIARLRARQHLDLRPTLDLEQSDGIAVADLVVDRGVVVGNGAHVELFATTVPDKLQTFLHQRQHAQRQKIDLDEARVVTRILVPLTDVAAVHRRRLDRHQLHHRSRRDDHPADMLADVPRKSVDLLGEVHQVRPHRTFRLTLELRQGCQLVADRAGHAAFRQSRQLVNGWRR